MPYVIDDDNYKRLFDTLSVVPLLQRALHEIAKKSFDYFVWTEDDVIRVFRKLGDEPTAQQIKDFMALDHWSGSERAVEVVNDYLSERVEQYKRGELA